jgi:hypothetical protein
MSEDEYSFPQEERELLLAAALRVLLAERNWATDAVPQDDEHEAKDAFALKARTFVRAIDALPEGRRPCGWDLDDAEKLRVQVRQLTEERNQLRAWADRQNRVLDVFVGFHRNVHPLPEDARKRVLAAMDGTTVDEVKD